MLTADMLLMLTTSELDEIVATSAAGLGTALADERIARQRDRQRLRHMIGMAKRYKAWYRSAARRALGRGRKGEIDRQRLRRVLGMGKKWRWMWKELFESDIRVSEQHRAIREKLCQNLDGVMNERDELLRLRGLENERGNGWKRMADKRRAERDELRRRLEGARGVLGDIDHRQSVAVPAYCLLCGCFVGEGGAHADKCKLAAALRGGKEE